MLMVTRNGTADLKGTVLVAAVMPNENCYSSNQKTYRWCYRFGGAIDIPPVWLCSTIDC